MEFWLNINFIITIVTVGYTVLCRVFISDVDWILHGTGLEEKNLVKYTLKGIDFLFALSVSSWAVYGIVYFGLKLI
jgi:hypothetical protein